MTPCIVALDEMDQIAWSHSLESQCNWHGQTLACSPNFALKDGGACNWDGHTLACSPNFAFKDGGACNWDGQTSVCSPNFALKDGGACTWNGQTLACSPNFALEDGAFKHVGFQQPMSGTIGDGLQCVGASVRVQRPGSVALQLGMPRKYSCVLAHVALATSAMSSKPGSEQNSRPRNVLFDVEAAHANVVLVISPFFGNAIKKFLEERHSKYGLRGLRVGESSHPGPALKLESSRADSL